MELEYRKRGFKNKYAEQNPTKIKDVYVVPSRVMKQQRMKARYKLLEELPNSH